jgi:hypothetical protein
MRRDRAATAVTFLRRPEHLLRDHLLVKLIRRTARAGSGRREWVWLALDLLVLLLVAFAVGAIISLVRFRTAQLPWFSATSDLGVWSVFLTGLRWLAVMVVVFAAFVLVAYMFAGRNWRVHRADWHRIVVRRGVGPARGGPGQPRAIGSETAPLGDHAVRIVAGFNVAVLSGVVTAIAVTAVQRIVTDSLWVLVVVAIVTFLGLYKLLTDWGPLKVGPRTHAGIWVLVALVAAMLTTLPLGLLILIGVAISTGGRALARTELPRTPSRLLRSPLAWMLLSLYTLVGVAYYAVPPVPFQRDLVSTPSGQRVAGYLSGTAAGTYLVTCQALADATSYQPRVTFVRASQVLRSRRGGPTYYLDSGDRPSLATLAMRTFGVSFRLPVPIGTGLRPREPTCAGSGPTTLSHGFVDPALGAGVIAGPPPTGSAADRDQPIEQTTPAIARLARQLQPILEVSAADENWPVSVRALLADRGPRGATPCLHDQQVPSLVCPATLKALSRSEGNPSDYLQYPTPQARTSSPSPLSGEPQVELGPFATGQGTVLGSLHHWLADPGVLNPWASAQIYFVDAGRVPRGFPGWPVHDPRVPAGLLNLEYWFYYQYNYFPTLFDSRVMNGAPIAGDLVNSDLHQGDWEHVDVLVDPVTHTPEWLYLARHANEGTFVPWRSLGAALSSTHPIVQAAFGGHPSYTTCGEHVRNTPVPLSDWVVCGYPRFAFRASTTPLVDLRAMPWACWRGHFGYAGPGTIATTHANALDQASTKYYDVAGPPSPLRQAENSTLRLCP